MTTAQSALRSKHSSPIYLNARASPPSRATITRRISNVFSELLPAVRRAILGAPGRISFTTDEWTSPNKIAFKCVTAHWIDSEWRLKDCILGFEEVAGSHSAEALFNSFNSILDTEDVIPIDRVFGITLDNASSNLRFLDLMTTRRSFRRSRGFRCLAHVINIACQALLDHQDVKVVVEKIRAISR